MMKRLFFASAALVTLLAGSPAAATPVNSFPVVTGLSTDFVCGYAAASPFGVQCYTLANVAAKASLTPPGGSTTQIQFNNSGAFAGVPGFTWNGSTLTLPSTTLPDGGTLTSSLNTFAKPSFYSGADNTPAETIDSSGAHFGTLFASGSDAWALGISTSSTGAGTGIINWSQVAGSNLIDLTASGGIDLNGSVNFKNVAGSTTWATFSGASGKFNLPFGSVLQMSGAGFSADAASGATVDLGNGNAGDTSGALNLATLSATNAINPPSVAGLQADLINTTTFRIGQPLTLIGAAAPVLPVGSLGTISYGGGYGISLIANSPSTGQACDPLSYYCIAHQVSLFSVVGGAPFVIANLEGGQNDNQAFEIGQVRAASHMLGQVAQLYFLDNVYPAGAVQNFTVTAPGSGYTQATTTVTLTPSGCAINPAAAVAIVNNTTGQLTGVSATVAGKGCASVGVTINSSGGGTGATATATLVSGTTDASVGPTVLWHQGYLNITGPDSQIGLGQCDLTHRCLMFGTVTNTGGAWETNPAAQPYFATGGHIVLATANGTGNNGFTWGEQVYDSSGVAKVRNGADSADAGVSVGFVRLVATTVSGLATVDASPATGDRATVTDATACTYNATLTGGGSTPCGAIYLAGAWKAG